jgi:L-serine dehydratase
LGRVSGIGRRAVCIGRGPGAIRDSPAPVGYTDDMIPSIFNDVIGPVMRGASSSHCAAALRIGRLARDLAAGATESIEIIFDTRGSLPTTHRSQGSDMGLFGGVLGWEADDERLPESARWLAEKGIHCTFEYRELNDPHPNTYHLELNGPSGRRRLTAVSTGGGMVEVTAVDDVRVSIGGDFEETLAWFHSIPATDPETLRESLNADEVILLTSDSAVLVQIKAQRHVRDSELREQFPNATPFRVDRLSAVLPVRSRRGLSVPFQSCEEMLGAAQPGTPLWQLAVGYESARSGLDEAALVERMQEIVGILRKSIRQGLRGTEYQDRILGAQSGKYEQALQAGTLIDAGLLDRIIPYTAALMEVKSSMGVIVAAPTAGACAALPATCIAAGEALGLDDVAVAKAMLAAGLIGIFIATRWTFAAEAGGCQAEGGSAAAMAAAALVDCRGGSLAESTGAASMALQNMLGLICDPVAGRVEVPCLGKNVMAASNALSCANLALAGFDAVIPLDQVIDAARSVAAAMPREHRCTALGGLADTEASRRLEIRLRTID